jgi:lactoylglutathione lyase
MKLNHLNLSVPDVSAASQFFVDYFGLNVRKKISDVMIILEDDDGFVLNLQHFKREVKYPDFLGFHVGFKQPSREQVDRIYARMLEAGVAAPAPQELHGAWTFYVKCPGGFFVEVYHQHRAADSVSAPLSRG